MPRISCILPIVSQYQSVHTFVRAIYRGLKHKGVDVQLLDPNRDPLFADIESFGTDVLLSVNSLLEDQEDRLLADRLGIPHFAFLVDGPHHFMPFTFSPRLHLSCVDAIDAEFFRKELHFAATSFIPHAVDLDLVGESDGERDIDLLFTGTYIDYHGIRSRWREQLPAEDIQVLENSIERCQEDPHLSHIEALRLEIKGAGWEEELEDLNSAFIATLWSLMDLYLRGEGRLQMLQAMAELGRPLHIYGKALGKSSWEQAFPQKPPHLHIHGPLEFEAAIAVMKRSRVLLHNFPSFKAGIHERALYGLAAGAVVAADSNAYLQEEFADYQTLLLYDPSSLDQLQESISTYLEQSEQLSLDPELIARHSWDRRVDEILNSLGLS